MTTGIVIPAHMGSTRFPGKPLAEVGGKPLLSYAVAAARNSGMPFVVATSDSAVFQWCDDVQCKSHETTMYEHVHHRKCRNGTERAAFVNQSMHWDRVIVLQCDEPDVTGEDLRHFSRLATPSTMCCRPSESDWRNRNSVFVNSRWHTAMSFERGMARPAIGLPQRHVGVYLYGAELLERYLDHAPTPAEEEHSLEQLRTMALGYTWGVHELDRECRSINVQDDVKKFKEYGHSLS